MKIHVGIVEPSDQLRNCTTETNSEAALNFHYDYFENDKFSLSYSACYKGMSSPHPYLLIYIPFSWPSSFHLVDLLSSLFLPEELTEIYLLQICPMLVTNVDAQNHKKNGLISRFWKVTREKIPRIKMHCKQNIELNRIKEWIGCRKFCFFCNFFLLVEFISIIIQINVNVWLLRTMA